MSADHDPRTRLNELLEIREKYRTRLFLMLLEIAVIFGVPAAIAVFVGRALQGVYGDHEGWVIGAFAVAFIISWVIVVWRVRRVGQKMKEIEDEIKERRTEVRRERHTSSQSDT